jgi:hypothetical protein
VPARPRCARDAALGEQEPAVALVHDAKIGREPKGREPPSHLGAVELLELEPVLDARTDGALEDAWPALDRARDPEQPLAGLDLELAPERVRAPDERHVARVLEVGLPDDARQTVRGAELVGDLEALDPEHAPAAPREMVERRAAHPADSDHDDVVPLGHRCDPRRPRFRSGRSAVTLAQAG